MARGKWRSPHWAYSFINRLWPMHIYTTRAMTIDTVKNTTKQYGEIMLRYMLGYKSNYGINDELLFKWAYTCIWLSCYIHSGCVLGRILCRPNR